MFIRFWYGSVYETYFPPCDTWKYAFAGVAKEIAHRDRLRTLRREGRRDERGRDEREQCCESANGRSWLLLAAVAGRPP
jgi:hypothetical protein